MKLFERAGLLLVLFFAAIVGAEAVAAAPPAQTLSELACQFETSTRLKAGGQVEGSYIWRLWRSGREVEVYQVGSRDGEAWMLDGAGGVMFARILHPERAEVVFNAMELRILGRPADWARCASLVSKSLLEQLKRDPQSQVFQGLEVFEYSGLIGTEKWTVRWSDAEQLAVSIEVDSQTRISTTVLMERYALKDQPWERLRARGYEQIGYTELGDNDTDPRMKRIMSRMGISCSHNGCSVVCLTPSSVPKK